MHAQRTDSTFTTERFERTINLSAFEPEHRPAIIQTIEWAEDARIVAAPYRYLPTYDASVRRDLASAFVAFREEDDYGRSWYAVLNVDTQTTYNGDTVLQAWREAREDAR